MATLSLLLNGTCEATVTRVRTTGNRMGMTGTSHSSRLLRAAKFRCVASLDLQAEPLRKGVTYTDPRTGKTCKYIGRQEYPGHLTNRFGKTLSQMKEIIKASGNFQGAAAEDEKRLCLAVAMQEASLMDAHDFKKKGLEANHSIYNLNSDMLLAGGFNPGLHDFDDWDKNLDHMSEATKCLLNYIRGDAPKSPAKQPAHISAINFVRGGRTSYNNGGGDWMTYIYRRAIQTIVLEMNSDYSLMGDNWRIEIDVPYY